MLGALFCRGLLVKNVEGISVDGGLAWEASEEWLTILSGPFYCPPHVALVMFHLSNGNLINISGVQLSDSILASHIGIYVPWFHIGSKTISLNWMPQVSENYINNCGFWPSFVKILKNFSFSQNYSALCLCLRPSQYSWPPNRVELWHWSPWQWQQHSTN